MKTCINKRINLLAVSVATIGLMLGGVAFAASESPEATPAASAEQAAPAHAMNWFGGPVYQGQPSLEATVALVTAGGGAENFSFQTALVSMLGEETVQAEIAKLTKQYGASNVNDFVEGMDFAVKDSLVRVAAAGIQLPAAPAELNGTALAEALVHAGTAPDGIFWSGWLFDNALSNAIHVQVMADIDVKYGHGYDENTHRILNQAMYDVAQAMNIENVALSPLH